MGGAEKKTVYTWVSTNPAASYNWIIGTVESVYEGVTYITSILRYDLCQPRAHANICDKLLTPRYYRMFG